MQQRHDAVRSVLAESVDQRGIGMPALSRAGQRIEVGQLAQRAQHQPQRQFGHGLAVGARHVAHRDSARAGSVKVDGVHAHADLLDQLEVRPCVHHGGGHGFQHMQQHLRIGDFAGIACGVVLIDDGHRHRAARGLDNGRKAGAGAVLQDGLHRASRSRTAAGNASIPA